MPETQAKDSNNGAAPEGGAPFDADYYIRQAGGDPKKVIDFRWVLREDIARILEEACRNLEIACMCLGALDDLGAIRSMIRAATCQKHAGVLAGHLRDANNAAASAGVNRR